ncbi:MAG: glycosyltransferase [Sphingomonas sp.]|uniref:glycosyltransferase n=1 Tax=Sphingomonas sp. TaxID=28214 RepID=UPI003F40C756
MRDRRVLRQCALLETMGHRPLVIAYGSEADTIPFPVVRWPVPQPSAWHRLKTVARQVPSHFGLWAARAGFWVEPRHRWAFSELMRARPRLVVANDWPALVVAAAFKARTGALVYYDTHEFATLEFDESRWWRFVYKPMVTHLERADIGVAESISTVGPRLAEALQARYRLATMPAVVRSIPDAIELPEAVETPWPLRILYHGQVLPDRGLEALIDSIPHWREPHRLTIRGDGQEGYLASLKRRAAATGRADLVGFEPSVKPDDVMPIAARSADLGVHFTPLDSNQRHFSLPNKLFEYIGSGLAVAVSPGADLKRVVEGYGVGVVSSDAGVAAVATAINGLTQQSVEAFKARARLASRSLCWEEEQAVMRSTLAPLLSRAALRSSGEQV